MRIFKLLLLVLGVLAALMGFLWIGQGLGLIMWPADSFMLGEPTWSWRGALLMGVGFALVWIARRR